MDQFLSFVHLLSVVNTLKPCPNSHLIIMTTKTLHFRKQPKNFLLSQKSWHQGELNPGHWIIKWSESYIY